MEDTTPASPASSTASDSDGFNTESARLYFGPVKTPERKFVAHNKRLFPLADSTLLRRSPRLSSPRPQEHSQHLWSGETDSAAQEAEDIDLVAQLVNEVEVDDDDEDEEMPNSQSGTPQKGDLVPDEPSSALADRVLHAIDNPSPPPSPPAALKMFDPYHTTIPESSVDYREDLISLNAGPVVADDNPLLVTSTETGTGLSGVLFSVPEPESRTNDSAALISFDSPNTSVIPSNNAVQASTSSVQQTLSVDDMLAQSPDPKTPVVALGVKGLEDERTTTEDPMDVDSPRQMAGHTRLPEVEEHSMLPDERQTMIQPSPLLPIMEETIVTPLRRSSRPRKSAIPTHSPQPVPPPPPVFTAPPSTARTFVKKKHGAKNEDGDEVVNDSQDEQENGRHSPSRALPSTPRGRQRSPGKDPLAFHRAVGSLSPTSANLLSTLAFIGPDDTAGTSAKRSAFEPPPVFSFSIFGPSADTVAAAPSTPIRSDGPKRVPSPPKAETSPAKFRLQSPGRSDQTSTSARRIPMEQAIVQGQLSPEKAAQMGFKPSVSIGTPSATVSTPARRVLISDKHPPPVAKSTTLRFGSPSKQTGSQRERSAEPIYRPLTSMKGKERAVSPAHPMASSSAMETLPFPIVAVSPVPSAVASSSTSQPAVLEKPLSSPAKSSLKQVTSRIPRINSKPYTRDAKTSEKARGGTTIRAVDSTKKTNNNKSSETITTARRSLRVVEPPKPTASSLARTKPTISTTSTTVLKRKREVDQPPTVKPRIVPLRQVPSIAAPPSQSSNGQVPLASTATAPAIAAAGKGKKQAQGTIRIRRVVDPPPKPPSPVETPRPLPPESSQHPVPVVDNSGETSGPDTHPPNPEPSSPIFGQSDLPPGSPMTQDGAHQLSEPNTPAFTSAPMIVVTEPAAPPLSIAEPISAGLRRTTRARKAAISQESVSEGSSRATSRRKAISYADDVFSGMSITALKELTTSNTVKNQHYLAARLETEVVKKDGLRPESPAVKIRTIAQRQLEEKEKEREERAIRRARRGGDELGTSDMEASSEMGYSSPCEEPDCDMDADDELPRHTRGAGDDEDYETPDRPLREAKATLFGDKLMEQRSVKWERGLFTIVYLDEVKLGTRQNLKENRPSKGILAPAAKALRLDTLGNLIQVDTPLAELTPENVTVKKFVYENDVVAVPEPPAPKPTRSKSKRK